MNRVEIEGLVREIVKTGPYNGMMTLDCKVTLPLTEGYHSCVPVRKTFNYKERPALSTEICGANNGDTVRIIGNLDQEAGGKVFINPMEFVIREHLETDKNS